MAEHVTQYALVKGARRDDRLAAVLHRFGSTSDARGPRRDAGALFDWLAAAKGRLPVATVRQHVCRHDEGVGACTVDREA